MEVLRFLVIAAQSGDLDAFSEIVRRFQDMAYACAYAMLGDAHLAEDAAQEAFIEAYLNLPKLREPAAFPGWFRRIIFKQGDRLLRGKHIISIPLETVFDMPLADLNPASIVEAYEMHELVRHAVEALPERERSVTLLFYITGYSLKEIAAFLEIPVSTVKKRLYDARSRLKESLMDMLRDSLYQQRLSRIDRFPNIVRLLIATRTGDITQVKALLERNPMLINAKVERNENVVQQFPYLGIGHTPLFEAATSGHTSLVDLLLDYGADISARTSSGQTPLHSAVLSNSFEVVQRLLARGADANIALTNGLTPLHYAAMKGYRDIVELLLARDALVSALDELGRNPLDWAVVRGHKDIAQVLQRYSDAGSKVMQRR